MSIPDSDDQINRALESLTNAKNENALLAAKTLATLIKLCHELIAIKPTRLGQHAEYWYNNHLACTTQRDMDANYIEFRKRIEIKFGDFRTEVQKELYHQLIKVYNLPPS